jgi:RNA polymerase sigma-70 factor, ECF subfamily
MMRLELNGALSAVAIPALAGGPVSGVGDRTTEHIDVEPASADVASALLAEVYMAYSAAIHSYAYRLLGNQEDADDVTQEVFIRAHDRLEQLRDRARLRPWLYRIATNLCMDQLRRRARTRRIFGVPVTIDAGPDSGDTGPHEIAQPGSTQGIDGVAERDHIARALRRMPPKYATCLILHSAQGLSYREVAEVLGITPGAAAVRLVRARDMFGRHYEDLREEERR